MHTHIRTAEFVSPNHPDKLCDRIADTLLDAYLERDQRARCAIEVLGGHGRITVTGEVTAPRIDTSDIERLVHTIAPHTDVHVHLAQQSPEIARGVDTGGAGDQGIMIGYACDETDEMLPREYVLARSLNRFLFDTYREDGKTQVTLENGRPIAIVASWANVARDELEALVRTWLRTHAPGTSPEMYINPAGDWRISGFDADAGLSGRKIVIDAYGPRVPIGGGAFSGKDGTKVDRSAAYRARRAAVHLLKKHDAHEVLVRVAYAIGEAYPIHLTATIDGVEHDMRDERESFVPANIIASLRLTEPRFAHTARWGHFGNGFAWDDDIR